MERIRVRLLQPEEVSARESEIADACPVSYRTNQTCKEMTYLLVSIWLEGMLPTQNLSGSDYNNFAHAAVMYVYLFHFRIANKIN